MPRPIHFEIHADDVTRAVNFYTSIFGWEKQQYPGVEDYWLVMTGPKSEPGIDGAIMQRHGPIDGTAVIAYVCTIDVPNLDDYVAKVLEKGGTMALAKMPVPHIGWLAYCKDSEGNIFGMMQNDPNAA